MKVKSMKSERISPFWVGGYPPFSASMSASHCSDSVMTSSVMNKVNHVT